MNIIEAIEQRKSVRTFDGAHPLDFATIDILRQTMADAESPFDGEIQVELEQFDLGGSYKPSTYGTISGAQWYFLMGMDNSPSSRLKLGYVMEQVVLKATEMGLGTCWIAATFNGTDFARAAEFNQGITLRVVMPVGYPDDHRKFTEKLTRMALKSAKRKPFDQLFEGDVDRWRMPLEMMRLAPSAKNSQPWRALCTDDKVYFYYEQKTEVALIDMGIALCHFDLAARQLGLPGRLTTDTASPARPSLIPVATFAM